MNKRKIDQGNRIKEIREKLGLDQAAFGKIIGNKSRSAVCKYELGDADPPIDNLQAIAEIGGVTTDWLITGKEPRTAFVCEQLNEDYHAGQTDEEIIRKHTEEIVGCLERDGIERFVAEKMFNTTLREILSGKGDEGVITLGAFVNDAKKREKERAARQGRAAEEEEKPS
jgi:transcriptional regulator with XRE-family HTH domain